ncbi:aldo/keto reductase [Candidatus Chlorohelix allophototropha]|uniref:aldo/keto reductase n=1 Tax=Candidatus Chlorohelix allophototropha TaxID=3003348 RepID=UPI003CE4E74B
MLFLSFPYSTPTCRELGIGFVAYSPLGRGLLTGNYKRPEDFEEGDYRRHQPRFQGENFQKNLELVAAVEKLAEEKGAKASQVALAWLLAKGLDIIPIPGTKRQKYLEENMGAIQVKLTEAEVALLENVFKPGVGAGTRYPETAMRAVNL